MLFFWAFYSLKNPVTVPTKILSSIIDLYIVNNNKCFLSTKNTAVRAAENLALQSLEYITFHNIWK